MPALRRVHRVAAHLDRKDSEVQAARDGEGGVRTHVERPSHRSSAEGHRERGSSRRLSFSPMATSRQSAARGHSSGASVSARQRESGELSFYWIPVSWYINGISIHAFSA